MYCKSDIFPREKTSKVDRLMEYPKFGSLIGQRDVSHFCLYMDERDRIYYQKRDLSQNVIKTFDAHGREARKFKQFSPNTVNFAKVYERYRSPPIESNRTNADTRTGFKMGSDYLVKTYFTFGQRVVQKDEAHVIQTLAVPILFFLRPLKCGDPVANGLFPTRTLHKYDRRILLPDTRYRVPPCSVYVLFCVQKTFFRLDLVDKEYVLPFHSRDPVIERIVKIPDPYDKPVETPFIEDQQQEKMATTYLGFSFPSPPREETGENPSIATDSLYEFLNPTSQMQQLPFLDHRQQSSVLVDHQQLPFLDYQQQSSVLDHQRQPQQQQQQSLVLEQQRSSVLDHQPQQQQSLVLEQQQQQQSSVLDHQPQQQSLFFEQQQQPTTTYFLFQSTLPPVRETSVVRVAPEEFVSTYRRLSTREVKDPREKFVADENWNPLPMDLTVSSNAAPPAAAAATAAAALVDLEEEEGEENCDDNPDEPEPIDPTVRPPTDVEDENPNELEWDPSALIDAAIADEERLRSSSEPVPLIDDYYEEEDEGIPDLNGLGDLHKRADELLNSLIS